MEGSSVHLVYLDFICYILLYGGIGGGRIEIELPSESGDIVCYIGVCWEAWIMRICLEMKPIVLFIFFFDSK